MAKKKRIQIYKALHRLLGVECAFFINSKKGFLLPNFIEKLSLPEKK
jgi:hypothetical protein